MSYKRVFGAKTRKVATRKPAKRWFCRVFAWRPFAPPGKDQTPRSDYFPWQYINVATRDVIAVRRLGKDTTYCMYCEFQRVSLYWSMPCTVVFFGFQPNAIFQARWGRTYANKCHVRSELKTFRIINIVLKNLFLATSSSEKHILISC